MVERPVKLTGFHPLRFFSKLGSGEKNAAFFTSGTWQIIGWNPSQTIKRKDASVFDQLKKLSKKKTSLPFAGGAIGYCSTGLGWMIHGLESRHRSALPLAVFHVYDRAVLWNGKDVIVVGDNRFSHEVQTIHNRPFTENALEPFTWTSTLSKTEYQKKFRNVMRGIREGDFYQLNLSYPFVAESDIDRRRLFAALAETHPAPCAAYFEHDTTAIISLSPERFVTIKNDVITTCPIKGTRPRGKTPMADKRLAEGLIASSKEAAELNMITDLLRNDVGKVSSAGSVNVLTHRALQKNPSVWHTYSVIRGTLEKNLHPVDAFASMFPGGSVTGCPKVAAMKAIDRLEDQARGTYCGSMLMVSAGGNIDSTILIRTIVSQKTKLTLGMGGGIVADSDCVQEYEETLKKAQPFLVFSASKKRRYFRGQREISENSILKTIFDPANSKISGVFETMRVDSGRIHDLTAHIARLRNSAKLLGIRIPFASVLRKNIGFAVRNSSGKIIRVKIVCTDSDSLIETRPLTTDPARAGGISVIILSLNRALPEAKSLSYHCEYAAHQTALQKGFHEALLKRSDGSVSEGAYSNLFLVKAGTLWTADSNILFGITRQKVIKLAKRLKIPVRYVSLQEEDIPKAEEIFITNSLSGITPVIQVDQSLIGNGKVGSMTQKLMAKW